MLHAMSYEASKLKGDKIVINFTFLHQIYILTIISINFSWEGGEEECKTKINCSYHIVNF